MIKKHAEKGQMLITNDGGKNWRRERANSRESVACIGNIQRDHCFRTHRGCEWRRI